MDKTNTSTKLLQNTNLFTKRGHVLAKTGHLKALYKHKDGKKKANHYFYKSCIYVNPDDGLFG